jgi:hypothetical protein
MKKEATLKNAKGIIQNTFDRKKGKPKKCKWAYPERLPMKKMQPKKHKGAY